MTDLAHGSREVAVVCLARDHEVDGRLDVALSRGVVLEVARHAQQHQQHAWQHSDDSDDSPGHSQAHCEHLTTFVV